MLLKLFGKPILVLFAAAHRTAGEPFKHSALDAIGIVLRGLALALFDQVENLARDPVTGQGDRMGVGGDDLHPAWGGGILTADGYGRKACILDRYLAKVYFAQSPGPGTVGHCFVLCGAVVEFVTAAYCRMWRRGEWYANGRDCS